MVAHAVHDTSYWGQNSKGFVHIVYSNNEKKTPDPNKCTNKRPIWRLRRLHKGPLPVWGDPECVPRRLRCIPAWGGAPSPMAPKPRRYTLRKLPNSHSTPLKPHRRHTPSRPQRRSLIIPSFPFLLVRCASSLHIILFPPLLLDAILLLLCAYFFSAAQPHNPHSYIYRCIFAVVWQIQLM